MRFILCFYLLFSTLFASDGTSGVNIETQTPTLASEAEPFATVAGSVNAISGAFFYQETDLITPTIEPITLTRSYDSAGEVQGSIGFGVGLQYPILASDCQHGKYHTYAYVDVREGQHLTLSSYDEESRGDDHHRSFKVDKRVQKKGCASLTGKGNLKNFKGVLRHKPTKAYEKLPWEVVQGDGTRKRYFYGFEAGYAKSKALKVPKGSCFLLFEEIKPNGNRLKFTYDFVAGIPFIKTLETVNRAGKRINFLEGHDLGGKVLYQAPTGEYVNYCSYGVQFRRDHEWIYGRMLNFIAPSHFAQSTISYSKRKDKTPLRVSAIHKQGGFEQVVEYDSKDRVKSLTHTVGTRGEKVKTHTFNYGNYVTYVKDCLGHGVHYHYDKEKRVTHIIRYQGATPYRTDQFIWGQEGPEEGWLKKKKVIDETGLLYTKKYDYDSRGNVLQETLVPKSGQPYTTNFEYAKDRFNSLTRIIRPEGLESRFSYLEGTCLKTKELQLLNGVVSQRKFFSYDDNGQISEMIEDDGSALSSDDLSDVTYRRVQKVYGIEEEGVCFGKPKKIENLALLNNDLTLLNFTEYSYDDKGNQTAVRVYDSRGQLESESFKVYDERQRIITTTDPAGLTLHYEYDHQNNKVSETCPASGVVTKFHYDVANNLTGTTATYPDGDIRETSIRYDALGCKQSETDAYGNTTSYNYDVLDNLSEVIPPETEGSYGVGKIQTTYNALNQVIADTDGNGNTTKYYRNIFGDITLKLLPNGVVEGFNYTPGGHLESTVSMDGSKVVYQRDPAGRPIQKSYYDKNGDLLDQETCRYKGEHLLEKTDFSGLTTYYTYDGAGRLIAVTTGDKTTLYEKDDFGRDVKVITENRVHKTAFDPSGNIIEETEEDLNGTIYQKRSYRYDQFGNKIQVITRIDDEASSFSTTEYNVDQTIAGFTDEMGNKTHYTYDRNHVNSLGQRVLKVIKTDPLGRVTTLVYDALGRVKSEELTDKTLLFRAEKIYDPAGNLLEEVIFNPQAEKTYTITRTYDSLNRLISLTEENEKTTTNRYDYRGRLKAKTLPDGTKIETTYDLLDRPLEKTSSDGTLHTRVTYDKRGNVIKTEDLLTGTTTHATYDLYNRLVTETLPEGITLTYEYDPLDRVTRLTLPDESSIVYFYDPYHLRVLRRESPSKTPFYEITFDAYNLKGQLLKRTTPAGATTFTYDALGRLTSRLSPNYSIESSDYDAVSNLIQESETLNDLSIPKSYSYDSQDNLISEEGQTSNTFTYDAIGNCLTENNTSRLHNHLNQLTQTASETLQYDLNGRLIERPELGHTYTYDATGKLLAYTTPNDQYTFSYAAGPRLLKFTKNGEETSLLYFGDHEIGSIKKGTLTDLKIIDPTQPEATLAIESQGIPYFTQQDSKNNITALEDIEGNLVESYTYSAFQEIPRAASPTSPWRFANRRTLDTLSLFTYRLYDPALRRWITPDPLDFDDGYNLYAYNQNNPLRYYDPDGRIAFLIPFIITAGGSLVCSASVGELLVCGLAVVGYFGAKDLAASIDKRCGSELSSTFCQVTDKSLYTVASSTTTIDEIEVPESNNQAGESEKYTEAEIKAWGDKYPIETQDADGNKKRQKTVPVVQVPDVDDFMRDEKGRYIPASDTPHTQIRTKKGGKGQYTQVREYGYNGELVRDIDFTDHGRSDHPCPHEHKYEPNPTGGTPRRGSSRPMEGWIYQNNLLY